MGDGGTVAGGPVVGLGGGPATRNLLRGTCAPAAGALPWEICTPAAGICRGGGPFWIPGWAIGQTPCQANPRGARNRHGAAIPFRNQIGSPPSPTPHPSARQPGKRQSPTQAHDSGGPAAGDLPRETCCATGARMTRFFAITRRKRAD